MPENSLSELITAKEFAAMLGISVPALIKRANKKKVPPPLPRTKPREAARGKHGGPWEWRRSDVNAFLKTDQRPISVLDNEALLSIKEIFRQVLREENLI